MGDNGAGPTRRKTEKADFSTKGGLGHALAHVGTCFDSKTPGFGIRVSPKSKRTWIYRLRDADGNECPGSIPFDPALKIDIKALDYPKANAEYLRAVAEFGRIKAEAALTRVEREARDAALQRERQKLLTLEDAFESYVENRRVRRKRTPLSPETQAMYRKRYNRYLAGTTFDGQPVGKLVLIETTPGQWQDILEALAVNNVNRKVRQESGEVLPKNAGPLVLSRKEKLLKPTKTGAIVDAHAVQVLNLISGVYDYLEGRGLPIANPIDLVRKNWVVHAPERRTRQVGSLNMPAFWRGLGERKRVKQARDAVHLIVLTGFRSSAARRLRWEQVDFKLGVYHVQPGDHGWKGFAGLIPLPDAVLDLLHAIKDGKRGYYNAEFVFPAHTAEAPHLQSLRGTVSACCEHMGERISAHDLRRGYSSAVKLANKGDVTKVGVLLGHAWATDEKGTAIPEAEITLGYIQDELPALRHAANRTANLILEMSGAQPLSSENRKLLEREGLSVQHLGLDNLPSDDDDGDE